MTIAAILNRRLSVRRLPRLRSSTMGGACTGFRTIYALQITQNARTPLQRAQDRPNIKTVRIERIFSSSRTGHPVLVSKGAISVCPLPRAAGWGSDPAFQPVAPRAHMDSG